MDLHHCIELDENANLWEDACMVCGMKVTDPTFYETHIDLMAQADDLRKEMKERA